MEPPAHSKEARSTVGAACIHASLGRGWRTPIQPLTTVLSETLPSPNDKIADSYRRRCFIEPGRLAELATEDPRAAGALTSPKREACRPDRGCLMCNRRTENLRPVAGVPPARRCPEIVEDVVSDPSTESPEKLKPAASHLTEFDVPLASLESAGKHPRANGGPGMISWPPGGSPR